MIARISTAVAHSATALLKLAAGIGCIASLATAAPAAAGTITIDTALGCGSFLSIPGGGTFCISPTNGSGAFTIHNNTTEWAVTGFVVTTTEHVTVLPDGNPMIQSPPFDTASASTSRPDWSAAATHIGVDPVSTSVPPLFCIPAIPETCEPTVVTTFSAYVAQFSYASDVDNDILPGASDGSFSWSQALSFPFFFGLNSASTYEIHLAAIDGDATAVCTGALGVPGNPAPLFGPGPASSTCDAPSLAVDVSVPEPGSLALLGGGLVGFGLSRRRKRPVA